MPSVPHRLATPTALGRRAEARRAVSPLLVAGAAVAVGLLAFALVLWRQPDPVPSHGDLTAPRVNGELRSLPAPGVAVDGGVRMPRVAPDDGPRARIDDPEPASAGAAMPPAASSRPVVEPAPWPRGDAAAAGTTAPIPVDMPPPRYPPGALRRGESGEVVLRVEVDARGRPARVDVLSSSGATDLDRAAVAAASRWRFRPALRDGVPVTANVDVPIAFDRPR